MFGGFGGMWRVEDGEGEWSGVEWSGAEREWEWEWETECV